MKERIKNSKWPIWFLFIITVSIFSVFITGLFSIVTIEYASNYSILEYLSYLLLFFPIFLILYSIYSFFTIPKYMEIDNYKIYVHSRYKPITIQFDNIRFAAISNNKLDEIVDYNKQTLNFFGFPKEFSEKVYQIIIEKEIPLKKKF